MHRGTALSAALCLSVATLLDSATTAAASVQKTADIEYASVAGQALRLDL